MSLGHAALADDLPVDHQARRAQDVLADLSRVGDFDEAMAVFCGLSMVSAWRVRASTVRQLGQPGPRTLMDSIGSSSGLCGFQYDGAVRTRTPVNVAHADLSPAQHIQDLQANRMGHGFEANGQGIVTVGHKSSPYSQNRMQCSPI